MIEVFWLWLWSTTISKVRIGNSIRETSILTKGQSKWDMQIPGIKNDAFIC